jgi:SRSO17 transposase
MVGLRLFLPESWTSDPVHLAKARVPSEHQVSKTKPEIALEEIDRLTAAGVRFGCVLADAGYGLSAPFRQGLSERGLVWAVGVGARQKVYPADVALIFPVAGRGRPRKNHVPDVTSLSAEKTLASASWRRLSWRRGTKGPLRARFAAVRIKVADGAPQRIGDMGQQHLPGEEAWLIGEHRSTGERKYYLSNLPADATLKRLAGAVKARWACEQAHQQLKEELGLDHFEGRSWGGLHRHALMTMIAYAFLQSRRLNEASGGKKNPRAAAPAEPSSDPTGHLGSALHDNPSPMSTLQSMAHP